MITLTCRKDQVQMPCKPVFLFYCYYFTTLQSGLKLGKLKPRVIELHKFYNLIVFAERKLFCFLPIICFQIIAFLPVALKSHVDYPGI